MISLIDLKNSKHQLIKALLIICLQHTKLPRSTNQLISMTEMVRLVQVQKPKIFHYLVVQ